MSVRRTGSSEWNTENKEPVQTDWSGFRREELFTQCSQWISTWPWGQPGTWALKPSVKSSNYAILGKLLMLGILISKMGRIMMLPYRVVCMKWDSVWWCLVLSWGSYVLVITIFLFTVGWYPDFFSFFISPLWDSADDSFCKTLFHIWWAEEKKIKFLNVWPWNSSHCLFVCFLNNIHIT